MEEARAPFAPPRYLCANPDCRKPFKPTRSDAKTCSSACRQMGYRRRLGVTPRKGRVTANVHFRSDCDRWATPQELFDKLNREFGFTLDVCALPENAKCARYFTPADDGLAQEWTGTCWMNPPYGRTIGTWIAKAYEAARAGATVVCLIPSRTDTKWWHDYIQNAFEVRYLPGRLKFGGAKHAAPFPSVIVIFKPYHE